jgi:alanyl-tRNA synthetase
VILLVDRTPFYAESGGEVGDTGWIQWAGGEAEVLDTQKDAERWLHHARISEGELELGAKVVLKVDARRLRDIRRNHTATHLLHHYLRQVLGEHATQRGSEVGPDRLRFDFAHDKPLAQDEMEQVEHLINERILADEPVCIHEDVPKEEAVRKASVALFGEKYADSVRMIQTGDFSMELCGGQHVRRTGEIALFKFVGESALQSGVRRVEAVTGPEAFALSERYDHELRSVGRLLKIKPDEVASRVAQLMDRERSLQKEVAAARAAAAREAAGQLVSKAEDIGGIKAIRAKFEGMGGKDLADNADRLVKELGSGVVVLAGVDGKKVAMACAVSDDLVKQGFKAGDIIKAIGARGGGKPARATGGGVAPDQVDAALQRLDEALAKAS